MMPMPTLYRATAPLPSIRADAGDFVMVYPTHITVVRDHELDALTDEDRAMLAQVTKRTNEGTSNTV